MIVTLNSSLHSYAIVFFHTIFVGLTFHQCLIKIFQIVQESWKEQGLVVDESIDRWAEDVYFHNPLSKIAVGIRKIL